MDCWNLHFMLRILFRRNVYKHFVQTKSKFRKRTIQQFFFIPCVWMNWIRSIFLMRFQMDWISVIAIVQTNLCLLTIFTCNVIHSVVTFFFFHSFYQFDSISLWKIHLNAFYFIRWAENVPIQRVHVIFNRYNCLSIAILLNFEWRTFLIDIL